MQPTSLKRKEKDSDDEDFSDNGDGTGSEVKIDEEDDDELQTTLIASIAEKQRQLDKTRADLMARKKVAPPAAVTSTTSTSSTTTSSANRPTGKGKGAAETDLNPVRAAVGRRADAPAAAGSGMGRGSADVPRSAAGRGKGKGNGGRGRGRGRSDDDEEEEEQAPKRQRTVTKGSDEPAQPYMTYMLNQNAQSALVLAEYVLPCEVGSNYNQRDLDNEFVDVLARKIIEDGRSVFTQAVALLIAENTVPKPNTITYVVYNISRCTLACNFIVYLSHETYSSTPDPQLEQFDQWPEVKRLLATGESVDSCDVINAFASSVLDRLTMEDSENKITCFPLGGQHYCAANNIARTAKPSWESLKSFQCIIFFPMPLKFAQQVNITFSIL